MPTLYVIATPIGNLEDLSFRALRILKQMDLILCEDTRVTKKLLAHFQIVKPTISYHQHSRLTKLEYILGQLKQGKDLALVSDAGTPSISDPGAKLIKYLTEQLSDLKIIPIPGPSALIAALSMAGLPADKFLFFGFPPAKKKRKKFFEKIAGAEYTVVFYESCHRIIKTLEELSFVIASSARGGAKQSRGRQIVVCRELTKQFESIYCGSAEEILKILQSDKNNLKGEFVVVVEK